uniref:Docking protein 7 n=1 Tax=Equus asinus TaxID=9793 RepID=A0A9L0IPB7_EQUAS
MGEASGKGLESSSCPRPRESRSASCSTASSAASPPPRAPLGCGPFSQTQARGVPPPWRSAWPRRPWKPCSWRSGSASSPTPAGRAVQGTTAACPARRQRPATRMSAPAAGSRHGLSSPRPRPAHHKRGLGWRLPRPLGRRRWAPRGRPPSHCGHGSCRRSAARAPRTAALPRAATPPTQAASHPAPAAAWTCGALATTLARCSACHQCPGHLSPACAPARRVQLSTRCPACHGPTMTRRAACAMAPGTSPRPRRAALVTLQLGTWAARRLRAVPLAGWARDGGDRRQRPRVVRPHCPARPPASPGKRACPPPGLRLPSFPCVPSVEASR